MIRTLALRINALAGALRSKLLSDSIASAKTEIRKPDFTQERIIDDVEKAAAALESVHVYCVDRPLGPDEQDALANDASYERHLHRSLADAIGAGLLTEGAIQFSVVDTDRPGIKAALAQVAVVTSKEATQQAATQIDEAFRDGFEMLRQRLLDYAKSGMPRMRSEDQFDHLVRVIENTRAAQIRAPETMLFVPTIERDHSLRAVLSQATNAEFERGADVLDYLREQGFDLVARA